MFRAAVVKKISSPFGDQTGITPPAAPEVSFCSNEPSSAMT